MTQGGYVFTGQFVASLAEDTRFGWLMLFRKPGSIQAPAEDLGDLLSTLLCAPGMPKLEVPEELRYEEVMPQPWPCVQIHAADRRQDNAKLSVELSFDCKGGLLSASKIQRVYDHVQRWLMRRNTAAEEEASTLLTKLGVPFRPATS